MKPLRWNNAQPISRQETKTRKGQALVEFALIGLALLTLIFSAIEFGHLLALYATVVSASRDAARYGAAVGDNGSGIPRYQDCDGIRQVALRIGQLFGMTPDNITIQYDHGPGSEVFATCPPANVELGDRVVVTTQATYTPWIPLFPQVTLTITSTNARTILRDIRVGTGASLPTPTPSPTPEGKTALPPPLFAGISYSSQGNKCILQSFSWDPNPAWSPHTVSNYELYIDTNRVQVSPSITTYTFSPQKQLNNNASITISITAVMTDGASSEPLLKTFRCDHGELK